MFVHVLIQCVHCNITYAFVLLINMCVGAFDHPEDHQFWTTIRSTVMEKNSEFMRAKSGTCRRQFGMSCSTCEATSFSFLRKFKQNVFFNL